MFFVASLPRTRTYWLARYFDGLPGVTCHHELLNGLHNKQDFYAAMEQPGQVGNSDSGLFLTDFHARWPDAPVLIVERPVEDVYASLVDAFSIRGLPLPPISYLHEQREALDQIEALHVPYHRLDDRLPTIHDYLGVGPYNEEYAVACGRVNLQLEKIEGDRESYELWRSVGAA
jgi:hypothetical protein